MKFEVSFIFRFGKNFQGFGINILLRMWQNINVISILLSNDN